MHTVIDVALPIFAIIFAGILAGRLGLLGEASSEALNRFVYYVALPPLLFLGTARQPPAEFFRLPFIGAFMGALLAVFFTGLLFGRLVGRRGLAVNCLQGLTASFSNTGYLGIPLFAAAFGADQMVPALLATVVMNAVMIGLALAILEMVRHLGGGLWGALVRMVGALITNPLLLGPAAGVIWVVAAGGAPLPAPLRSFCELLGAAAGPCALFAVGLFLAGRLVPVGGGVFWGDLCWIVALKMFWQPVLTWLLADWWFAMDPFWTASAIILAALPTGAMTFVVARQYDEYVETTAAVILVSTLISVGTVSALLALFVPEL